MKRNKLKVYIAGPYTNGDVCVNVKAAMDMGDRVLAAGYNVFVPHLYHFMHMNKQHHYKTWIDTDIVWLEVCDAMIRIPSMISSSGSDGEEAYAKELDIPVFHSFEDFMNWTTKTIREESYE